jgi:hypothetical protein
MSSDLKELKERITGLSDEELIEMVTVEAGDYRREAVEFAKAELARRGVDIPKPGDEEEATAADFDPFPATPRTASAESVCGICGGRLRAGTLVAEKEMTIIFSDNREERFIKVTACVQCGQLSLVADFDTNVGS